MKTRVLVIEPFYGGSHKQLIDTLVEYNPDVQFTLFTLDDKKWHWKLRTSAVYFAQTVPEITEDREEETVLFASSMVNLADLVAIRTDLAKLKKIIYFHENQLAYPVQKEAETDFQLKWIQVVSAMAADLVLFNSSYNLESFRDNLQHLVTKIPMRQARPKNIWSFLEKKSNVLHFPVHVPRTRFDASPVLKTGKCRILWPHRWEHDKNPEEFFDVMVELSNAGVEFDLVILGQSYSELPENMPAYKDALQKHIMHMGFVNSKEEYWNWISSCDIVVSTAIHEFFGVAVIEAVALGCYPILPNRLAYPKLFPKDYLYSTKAQLVKKVRKICRENELLQIRSIASHTVLQNLVQNVLSWNMNGVYRDTILE